MSALQILQTQMRQESMKQAEMVVIVCCSVGVHRMVNLVMIVSFQVMRVVVIAKASDLDAVARAADA